MVQNNQKMSVKFISLGCPKNLVDSEVMAGLLKQSNYTIKESDDVADVGIVNTCGFIEDSKQESINTILELAQQKKAGKLKMLVVTGCLAQRYKEELPDLMPEVDAFLGTNDYSHLSQVISQKLKGSKKRNFIETPQELPTADNPRIYSTPFYSRYIKISEGCSHTCSFCTIPLMRGGLKSRKSDDIIREMQNNLAGGTKEFNLIAQDLNEYGRDLEERDSLYNLLTLMAELKGDFWLRPLYMYPLQFPDKLIRLMKDHPHLCRYVDIPLQHIDDGLLKSMRRGSSSKYIYRLIENLRKEIPGIILRTTFIVGYPGETDEKFGKLHSFIREMEFDRLGVFTYSDEDSTHAHTLTDKIPKKIALERRDFIMTTQQKISLQKNKKLIGKTVKVLVENYPETVPVEAPVPLAGMGRFYGQAPEIDGQVFIRDTAGDHPSPGQFVEVKVTDALEYDLIGEITNSFAV